MSDPNVVKGLQFAQAGDFNQAAASMAQAVKVDPGNVEAWQLFGDYLSEPEKRRFCYRRVLELDPANEQAQISLELLDPLPNFGPADRPTQPLLLPASWLEEAPDSPETPDSIPMTTAEASADAPVVAFTWPEEAPDSPEVVPMAAPVGTQADEASADAPTAVISRYDLGPDAPDFSKPATAVIAEPAGQVADASAAAATVAFSDPAEAPVSLSFASAEPALDGAPDEQPGEPVPAPPVPPMVTRSLPRHRRRSPLRFLLYLFPLMLLILIGMLCALIFSGGYLLIR